MATLPIGILIIDDHDMFRAGLRLLLESEPGLKIIAEARSRDEALEAARNAVDVILLDLDLGSDKFRAGLRLLLESEPGLKIIAEARSRDEALEAARNAVDVILLDLDLGSDS